MISYSEAIDLILNESKSYGSELIPLNYALGRVLSEEIFADRDYPPFHRSAMDGFAISYNEYLKGKQFQYERELHAGFTLTKLPNESVIRIMTGAPVPEGFDVVIKIEDAILSERDGIRYVSFPMEQVLQWQNIAKQGEDANKGDSLLPIGTQLRLSEISLLASLGKSTVSVFSFPKVRIISTGNEVIPIHENPLPHQIRDSNSVTISTSLLKFGIIPDQITHVPDDQIQMENIVKHGLDCDILILSGGVSMGEKDLVPNILSKLGVKKIFHKTAIKPGKPIWFGKKENTIVFGLPGNPFSVQTCFRIFIDPYLRASLSLKRESSLKLPILGSKKKKHELTEFFPVQLVTTEKTYLVSIPFNGSGDIKAGRYSDGLGIFPSESKQLDSEQVIEFLPW
ncbi:molybdopterin molybdenumtransferase MoeA [Leptospira levettii]|uniref:molybdopterin molybdotransferase MoeA n=1 Tax=Leptospira levettii TaxID=2023178 RepID=UPI001083339F|nr:molybdopterin molybdotransferase MoeA [Leptospira levettii]TGM66393.1 molybdopterin molybdenumtransferase MoeA [Leptospira levettii]